MPEFSELLHRVRGGDEAALSELYDAYCGRVARAARRGLGPRLKSRYDTGDITQSVFGDVLRELPRFEDRGERAFQAWLLTKVRHKLASKARRQSMSNGSVRERRLDTEVGLAAPTPEPGPDALAWKRDDEARVTRLMGTLDAGQRTIIGLAVDEGLSWEQVAARMDLPSAGAARMRYVRAVATLRERWTSG